FNWDGIPDVAVGNYGHTISVLLGNGDGTLQFHVDYESDGDVPISLAVWDFNGDMVEDLVTANYQANTASVLLGNGDGTFQVHVDYAIGGSAYCVAVGDLNGDRNADLAIANANGYVSVLLGNGDGS